MRSFIKGVNKNQAGKIYREIQKNHDKTNLEEMIENIERIKRNKIKNY